MMNRRGFFKALGAAVVIVVAKPVPAVTDVVHITEVAPWPVGGSWIDMANAIAFDVVSNILPEHGDYYRQKAMVAAHKYMSGRRV